MTAINKHDDTISRELAHWKRVRDTIEGARAIRRGGRRYLRYEFIGQTDAAYKLYQDRVGWFPATSRTLDGYMGLVFRRRPVLDCTDKGFQELCEAITSDGLSIEQLSEKFVRETFTTNYTVGLVDMPKVQPRPDGGELTQADFEAQGIAPFIAIYPAQTVLQKPEFARVGGKRKMVRARLLEDNGNTVRELLLLNGIYTVRLHIKDEKTGQFVAQPDDVPKMAGKPLDVIPMVIITTSNADEPTKGLLDEIVELNHQHFRNQGMISSIHYWSSMPISYSVGVEEPDDGFPFYPGGHVNVPDAGDGNVEFGFWEFEGKGLEGLERERKSLEGQMARAGARILAAEQAGTEAAETHMIRRASENATLAAATRSVSAKIEQLLQWAADWAGVTAPVKFQLNTDYLPRPMGAQEITAISAAWQAGLVSHETAWLSLRDGEVMPETLTYEMETKRLEGEQAKKTANDLLAVEKANAENALDTTKPPLEAQPAKKAPAAE